MYGGWLNEKVINAGMKLLKAAFPHLSGFQDPMLQVTNSVNSFILCILSCNYSLYS